MPLENGNTDRLLGKLIAEVEGVRRDLLEMRDANHGLLTEHGNRISAIELRMAGAAGGTKMLIMLGGAAATVGGIVASLIGKIWPGA